MPKYVTVDNDICSRCRDHSAYTKDPDTGETLSECCQAPPMDNDYESSSDDR